MKKRTILITIILTLLIIVISGVVIWLKSKPGDINKIISQQKNLRQVTDGAVFFPFLLPDKKTILFLSSEKEQVIKKIFLADGKISAEYNLKDIPYITDISWLDNGNLAAIYTEENGEEKIYTYNLEKKTHSLLNTDVSSLVLTDDNRLAYCYIVDGGSYTFNISDWDGKNWEKIIDIDECHKLIAYTGMGKIFYLRYDNDMDSSLIVMDIKTKKITPVISSGVGLVEVSPDNKMAAAIVDTAGKKELSLMNLENLSVKSLFPINKNKSIKIRWSQDSQKIIFFTDSSFYQFDVSDNQRIKIGAIDEKIGVNDFVADDKALYFQSNIDNFLYELKVKK